MNIERNEQNKAKKKKKYLEETRNSVEENVHHTRNTSSLIHRINIYSFRKRRRRKKYNFCEYIYIPTEWLWFVYTANGWKTSYMGHCMYELSLFFKKKYEANIHINTRHSIWNWSHPRNAINCNRSQKTMDKLILCVGNDNGNFFSLFIYISLSLSLPRIFDLISVSLNNWWIFTFPINNTYKMYIDVDLNEPADWTYWSDHI